MESRSGRMSLILTLAAGLVSHGMKMEQCLVLQPFLYSMPLLEVLVKLVLPTFLSISALLLLTIAALAASWDHGTTLATTGDTPTSLLLAMTITNGSLSLVLSSVLPVVPPDATAFPPTELLLDSFLLRMRMMLVS